MKILAKTKLLTLLITILVIMLACDRTDTPTSVTEETVQDESNFQLGLMSLESLENEALITTYYWDNGWVEHASWISSIGSDLMITIDVWDWEPEYSPMNVKFDNVIVSGDIDPIALVGDTIDNFEDGITRSIWWAGQTSGVSVVEANGVLNIDILAGPNSVGWNNVGGYDTRDYYIHGDFDVQVDFYLNPEYHTNPNCNAKLFLTDPENNSLEISIRTGHYESKELFGTGGSINTGWTATNDLAGKLRITRQDISTLDIEIDIKPGSELNPFNCKNENGMIPVAVLTTDDFDATSVNPATVFFEGAGEAHIDTESGDPRRHLEDVDGDGDIDALFHFRICETTLSCESTEGLLTGNTFDGQNLQGSDDINMISY